MTPARKQRLMVILLVVLAMGTATAVTLVALSDNILYFYSPTEITEGKVQPGQRFRLGGIVLEDSFNRRPGALSVQFQVTDRFREVPVTFTGILPDLFREGQSVVALGRMDADGLFEADEVLAKHDETYMPKEVAEAIERAQARQDATP